MRKVILLSLLLMALPFMASSHDYVEDHVRCTERTMCDDPSEYPDLDYMDEVNIEGEGELWSGTIEIENVTYMHNFSEKVDDASFRNRDTTGPMDASSDDKIFSFDGVMRADSICNEPVFDVDVEESIKYNLEVRENDTYGVRSCYDHPVKVEYTLTLDTETSDLKVTVNQNNVKESFQTEDYVGTPENQGTPEEEEIVNEQSDNSDGKSSNNGLISNIMGIFSSIF